jgi:hypothetical protein
MSLEYKIEVSGNASIARYRCCTSTGCVMCSYLCNYIQKRVAISCRI